MHNDKDLLLFFYSSYIRRRLENLSSETYCKLQQQDDERSAKCKKSGSSIQVMIIWVFSLNDI